MQQATQEKPIEKNETEASAQQQTSPDVALQSAIRELVVIQESGLEGEDRKRALEGPKKEIQEVLRALNGAQREKLLNTIAQAREQRQTEIAEEVADIDKELLSLRGGEAKETTPTENNNIPDVPPDFYQNVFRLAEKAPTTKDATGGASLRTLWEQKVGHYEGADNRLIRTIARLDLAADVASKKMRPEDLKGFSVRNRIEPILDAMRRAVKEGGVKKSDQFATYPEIEEQVQKFSQDIGNRQEIPKSQKIAIENLLKEATGIERAAA